MTLSFDTPITPAVRLAVFDAWGDRCAYCRVKQAEEVDHIHPRAKGGLDRLDNYAAACRPCNRMKTDMVLGEGVIGIIAAKAVKKAPGIAKKLQPKTTAGKTPNPQNRLIEKHRLVDAMISTAKARAEANFEPIMSEDELSVLTHKLTAAVDQSYGHDTTITQLKALVSEQKRELRALKTKISTKNLILQLCELRSMDPWFPRGLDQDLLEAVRAECNDLLDSAIEEKIRLQMRLNKASRPDVVEVQILDSIRDLLIQKIIAGDSSEASEVVQISNPSEDPLWLYFKDHPNIGDNMRTKGELRFSVLFHGHSADETSAKMWFAPGTRNLLLISKELQAKSFCTPPIIDFGYRPLTRHCVAFEKYIEVGSCKIENTDFPTDQIKEKIRRDTLEISLAA